MPNPLKAGLIALFLPLSLLGQSLTQKIETAYAGLASDPQLRYASTSLTVLNTITGEVVFSKNGNMGLAPASTLKTVTSATAFSLLGPDFRFETQLGYTGKITAEGVLEGDLVITGGGDPTLGSWRYPEANESAVLSAWIAAIRKAGIKRVEGQVLADDRLFGTSTVPEGWIWQDIGNYYGAGPSSLTWRENQFDVIFRPGKNPGDPTTIASVKPAPHQLTLVNEVVTGKPGSGDQVYAFSAPYATTAYLRGSYGIDLKKAIALSVTDAPLEAVSRLLDTLRTCGIPAKGAATYRTIASLRGSFPEVNPLFTHFSPRLSQVVYWFNQKSVNLYGEHLIKTLAWKQGKPATTADGAALIREFWNKQIGLDKNALNIIDGSGLSPGTRVTTLAIAQILRSAKSAPWFSSYFDSFPTYNNMKMKSGSINDVLAYAGYQNSVSGVPLCFSFIINNYNGSSSAVKQKMFGVLEVLR